MIRMVHALLGLAIVVSVSPYLCPCRRYRSPRPQSDLEQYSTHSGLANGDFSQFGVKVVEHEFTTPADIITAYRERRPRRRDRAREETFSLRWRGASRRRR